MGAPDLPLLEKSFLTLLATSEPTVAMAHLTAFCTTTGQTADAVAQTLALTVVHQATAAPQHAAAWLALAQALQTAAAPPTLAAQLAYAQARLALHQGDLVAAATLLHHAQQIWRDSGDTVAEARTYLGLTHLLTQQGRYAEAQVAIQAAIGLLEDANDTAALSLLTVALRNQGNLFGYLHQHQAALDAYDRAQALLTAYASTLPADTVTPQQVADEAASIAVNRAVDLMALAQLSAAETALQQAIHHFEQAQNSYYASLARSNLASLYARTGQYMPALTLFEQVIGALWGADTELETLPLIELQSADVLFLDQALVFLALNLHTQAHRALALAAQLFTQAQRPYELGQTHYAQGLLSLQQQDRAAATAALAAAATVFQELSNDYWRNRVALAQVVLLQQQGDYETARALLIPLMDGDALAFDTQWYGWDLATATELYLQQLNLALLCCDYPVAQQAVAVVEQLFTDYLARVTTVTSGSDLTQQSTPAATIGDMSHLRFALIYGQGRLAQATGDLTGAWVYFQQAVNLLEAQRALLPLEEIRMAFLADKAMIYTDWLLTVLDRPDRKPDDLNLAFAIVERARSRTLLERLLATLDDVSPATAPLTSPTQGAELTPGADTRAAVRQHLHWLYNQLLGQDGARRLHVEQLQAIRQLEFRLEQLEQQRPLLPVAPPAGVTELQAALQPDEHALAYYIAGEDVLLFSITPTALTLVRRLCTLSELRRAQSDLQFQIGRIRMGERTVRDLDPRLQRLLRQALHRLYQLLLEKVVDSIQAKRLRFIPHGLLHQLPFHAFWTGERYLIEEFDCIYTPSSSIAVQQGRPTKLSAHSQWYGLAVMDHDIPETAAEVQAVATFFEQPQLYLGAHATRGAMQSAVQAADILHISTHGLMRSDNPLFSALKVADGWVDVREIYRFNVRAQLIVLSACRSGLSHVGQGDELLGLVRGFLGAGAHQLLVSQWDVSDAYVPAFMTQFYRALIEQGHDPAAALGVAQRQAIANDDHPFWWAPFFLIG
jgi:CHAT domain-containing protein